MGEGWDFGNFWGPKNSPWGQTFGKTSNFARGSIVHKFGAREDTLKRSQAEESGIPERAIFIDRGSSNFRFDHF